jgi:choline dehydrogenase-like flavoprotein
MGITQSGDFNSPGGREGAGLYDFNIRNGVRDGAAAALLMPTLAEFPRRLFLRTSIMVDKLAFVPDPLKGSRSSRVSELRGFDADGNPWALMVSKKTKVVLTAGAINTPTLLMKSGIGRSADLDLGGLGEPLVESPQVGHNIQDHPAIGLVFSTEAVANADMEAAYR